MGMKDVNGHVCELGGVEGSAGALACGKTALGRSRLMCLLCLWLHLQIRVKDDGIISNAVIGGSDVSLADVFRLWASANASAGITPAADGSFDSGVLWFPLSASPDKYTPPPSTSASSSSSSSSSAKGRAGRATSAGLLQLRLRFIPDPSPKLRLPAVMGSSGVVVVRAMSGKGLRNVQSLGTQDPFVSVELLPTPGDRLVTKTRPATDAGLNADWNQSLQVQ